MIHGLAVEGHRRGEGVGEGRRVGTDELAHAVEVARGHCGVQALLQTLQVIGGGHEIGRRIGENRMGTGQVIGERRCGTGQVGHSRA